MEYSFCKVINPKQFVILMDDSKNIESNIFDTMLHELKIDYDLDYLDDDVLEYTFDVKSALNVIEIVHEFQIPVLKIKR